MAYLREHQRFAEAVPLARRSLQLSEQLGDRAGRAYDLTNLAQLQIELGQFAEALELLRQTSDGEIQERDYYPALLGRALAGIGDHAAAVEAFARLQSYKMDQNIPLHHGLSLLRLGRLDEARVKLELATVNNPQPEAWNALGTVHAQQGRLAQALEAFQKAVQMSPENRYYRENLERVLQMNASAGALPR
jgi:tetratricopeptide (TPR) repeat protein